MPDTVPVDGSTYLVSFKKKYHSQDAKHKSKSKSKYKYKFKFKYQVFSDTPSIGCA